MRDDNHDSVAGEFAQSLDQIGFGTRIERRSRLVEHHDFRAAEQGARIAEVEVGFRPRKAGTSKYGLWRIVRTLLDLITVKFLSGYSTAPIQVFGLIGFVLGGLGSLWTLILVAEKIMLGRELGNRPALLLAVLLVVVGVQFVSIGLLGEMLARTYHESQGKPIYVIKEEF